METRQLNFDVSRGGIQHRLFARVGDAKSRTIIARMYSGSEEIVFSSARIRVLGANGDEHLGECSIEDNAAVYTLTTDDIGEGGEVLCEFVLFGEGGAIMTSPRFAVVCEKLLYSGDGVEGSDEYQAYIAALAKLENLEVSADSGDVAAVSKAVNDTGIKLHFTLPKGEPGYTPQKGVDYSDGEKGADGDTGATFTPSVDADGNLSWTNDKELENPETVNIKGKDGYTPVLGTDYWTEEDKKKIAETAAENVVNDYAIRETIYIGLDGYCYESANTDFSIPYPISNLEVWDKESLGKYNFVLSGRVDMFDLLVPLTVVYNDTEGSFLLRALASDEFDNLYYLIDGYYNHVDEAVSFTTVRVEGEYLNNYYGVLSVDKTALLGDIGDQTMKEYTDNAIGDIESALDEIIAIQNTLIGGTA